MNNAVKKYLKDRGYDIYDTMSDKISLWKQWYQGKVDSFHNYQVWNGENTIQNTMASMHLGKMVCESWANLLFNERVQIAVDDSASQTFLDSVLGDNNAWVKLNEFQEKKSALGTVAYVPYYTSKGIRINYVTAENMAPLTWENGVIYELAVYSEIKKGKDTFYYVQLFTLVNELYQIENIILQGDSSSVKTIPLADMPGYENVEELIATGSTTKPFVIDRPNIVNNIDMDSPFGVSVFANAINTMEHCDTIFDSYRNEYVLGRKRIMVSNSLINVNNKEKYFDTRNPVYQFVADNIKLDGEKIIRELDMSIRAEDHEIGLNRGLNTFSSQCGLGENYYRFDRNGGAATATEVISENNTMFRTLRKHELILKAVLADLARLILELGVRYNLAPGLHPDAEIIVTPDDSVIEDKDKQNESMKRDVDSGYIKTELYVAKKYGVTEEQARGMMPVAAAYKDDETKGEDNDL